MYAIVEIAGHQFKIKKDQKLFVNRMENEEGSELEFDQVLLLADKDNIKVGTPVVEGVTVKAKVLEHVKADKIKVFKKKRRKGYKVKRGHRQYLSQLVIDKITA